MIVELTGGVGSGKSRILEFLKEEYGAEILQTDETARQLQQKGEEGFRKMVEILGDGVLGPDGPGGCFKIRRRWKPSTAASTPWSGTGSMGRPGLPKPRLWWWSRRCRTKIPMTFMTKYGMFIHGKRSGSNVLWKAAATAGKSPCR